MTIRRKTPTSKVKIFPCTPPLMDEEKFCEELTSCSTKFKGSACEHLVYSYFLSKSINVAEPVVDDGVDLLVEKKRGARWQRGQIKKVVYTEQIDYGIKKRHGIEIRRSRYSFPLQGGGAVDGRKQRTPEEIDYFYHVLHTKYRFLLWETPSHLYPTRDDGSFIQNKGAIIDRECYMRKKADIDYSKYLVYNLYHPILFQTYPDFFIKPPTGSLEKFL